MFNFYVKFLHFLTKNVDIVVYFAIIPTIQQTLQRKII